MKRVGLVGWRGMVGSVLMERMRAEGDFALIEPVFFSTSQAGGKAPNVGKDAAPLADAYDIEALKQLDVIISCQGGDYTSEVHPKLRTAGFKGYWIDAASTLRMQDQAVIVLDPVNREVIDAVSVDVAEHGDVRAKPLVRAGHGGGDRSRGTEGNVGGSRPRRPGRGDHQREPNQVPQHKPVHGLYPTLSASQPHH